MLLDRWCRYHSARVVYVLKWRRIPRIRSAVGSVHGAVVLAPQWPRTAVSICSVAVVRLVKHAVLDPSR